MAGSKDDNPPPPPPPSLTPIQQTPHTVSTIKLPILKKGEYDIWAMKIEHYLAHTDYPIWEVIQRGNSPEAIKSRFGGNDESKKTQKFKSLLSQLEIHGAGVSAEDANQKFFRSLPFAWSQVSLIMRTKPGVDSLSFNDLYSNLRVFESDVKGSTASSSSTQTMIFISENTSSTNDLDEFDLEEMDLKWQVAMISMRMKKFYKKTGHFTRECRSKGNQDSRRRDAWNTGNKDKENRRRYGKHKDSKALVTLDGLQPGSDTEREQVGDASIEIHAYTQALKKFEAQLVAHQQSQLCQMSAKDKAGLGYDDQMNKSVLSYENEVFQSVFVSRTSDIEDSPVNDRYAEGMHAVPPPMTGIYIPSGPDKEIDDSQFTYGPKQSKPSESDARSSDFNSCESNCSEETHESMPKPVVNEPKVVSKPKVWSNVPIIEEYESDSEDEHVSLPTKEQEIPNFAFINTDKHVELNKQKGKGNVQRENKPVWNNVQRVNHKNQFVPTTVLTRTGKILVKTARS
ncbi:hypothetical protein Tco_0628896 [Tanacetum coccineum]|uniref:Uncharacterized protein n=1 Tax=Tanacetum coccineum TaxID=301880 RepID=A0ABQ4WRK5_9ASTR